MTKASRPHVICNADNLLVDTAKMIRASCPKHRPGYLCRSKTYHHFQKGAYSLNCAMPTLSLEDFPKDHLRDIMDSMAQVDRNVVLQARTLHSLV